MSYSISIASDKCTKCGLCVSDCTNFVLGERDGKIGMLNDHCVGCGHCIAVCPQRACSMDPSEAHPYPMDDVLEYNPETFTISPGNFLNALKFRRSVRYFRQEALPEELIRQIVEAGRFTPTAVNLQNTSYIVLQQDKDRIQAETMKTFRKLFRIFSWINKILRFKIDAKRFSKAKDDFLFKKAPAVILIISNNEADGYLASSNMECMANALGLGVLHVGFLTNIAKINGNIRKMLGLRRGQKIVDCLCVGYPLVHYLRTVPRNPAKITFR